jgi:hypothetical protein
MSVAANARAFKTATVRRERRLIVIRPEYLEIGGDISVAALLSQIVYWSEPDHTGRTKLRVQRDGVYWIAKARDEWMHETGLTMEQYKRAVSVLKRRGLIEVRVMRFNGLAIGHTRLIADALTGGAARGESHQPRGGKPANRLGGFPPALRNRDYDTNYIQQERRVSFKGQHNHGGPTETERSAPGTNGSERSAPRSARP